MDEAEANRDSESGMNGEQSVPRRLVVLVPGFNGHSSKWKDLRDRLEHEPGYGAGEAHWLLFDHGVTLRSLGGVRALAVKLRARIDAEWMRASGFDDVVLVGHSMGGPLVREAYLLGAGAVPGTGATGWARRVSRIVLLASVNRGIDTRRIWWLRPAAWMARNFPFLSSFLFVDLYRGSAFLTNLRINWIRHFGALAVRGDAVDVPKVIQLLGTEDSLVSPDDSKDVLALPGGHDLTVPDADHKNIYRFDNTDAELRYVVLREAFCGEFAQDLPDAPGPAVRRVIFLLHGIRASNVDDWIKGLEAAIVRRDPEHTVVRHPTYGYFSAARFTLPSVRRKNIATFQDWYTEVLAEHPTADFSIVAHSNGTYILGHSLLATPGMRFVNVALAGSVLPRDFWQRFRGRLRDQVGRIRNHRANRDWPVALLCSALRGLLMRDIGTAGFAGFDGDATDEVAYYTGGHGEALKPNHHGALVGFVFGDKVDEPASLRREPGSFRQLSNGAPYAAAVVAVLVAAAVGWYVFLSGDVGALQRGLLVGAGAVVLYVVLDII